jgi:uncharacterized iron-regulated membrane protein
MLIREMCRRVHFTLGILLSLPLAVLGLTGSILALGDPGPVFSNVTAPARATLPKAAGVDAIVRAAASAAPSGYRPTLYVAATHGSPARIVFAPALQLWVDPATLTIVRPAVRNDSLYAFAHDLHANVLAGATGRRVVGWLGVAMLVLGLTGPMAWWPGRRRLREAFVVRRGSSGFRLFRDLHRAGGIWVFLFLIVLSLTGTFIVFPEPIGRAIALVFPSRPVWRTDVPGMHRIAGSEPMSAGAGIALARTAVGGGRVRSIGFARANQPLRIELLPANRPASDGSVTVLIDPWSRRVLDVRDPHSYTLGERIISTLRPLHEGHVLGWPWRIALFAIGVSPLFFAVTGVTMWVFKRRRRRPARELTSNAEAARRGPRRASVSSENHT